MYYFIKNTILGNNESVIISDSKDHKIIQNQLLSLCNQYHCHLTSISEEIKNLRIFNEMVF